MTSSLSQTERLTVPDGGFTIDTTTGNDVTTGYAVATFPQRSLEVLVSKITDALLARFVSDNADLLDTPGNVFGGWHDPATGHAWLDISTVVSDRSSAIRLAVQANQIAIFDLDTGTTINTGGTGS